jgi:hypothetical protein
MTAFYRVAYATATVIDRRYNSTGARACADYLANLCETIGENELGVGVRFLIY